MARHARSVDPRARTARLVTLIVVWLAGLAAGFFSLLSAAAKYGCSTNESGLACRSTGSVLGILVSLAVVVVVTAVTVQSFDRPPRRVVAVGALGVTVLGLCFLAAQGLLSTI